MTHVKSDEFFVISESQILEDLLVILPKNDDEAAFQPNILPSTQNHEFLYFSKYLKNMFFYSVLINACTIQHFEQ